jgi:hypothetical protein
MTSAARTSQLLADRFGYDWGEAVGTFEKKTARQ